MTTPWNDPALSLMRATKKSERLENMRDILMTLNAPSQITHPDKYGFLGNVLCLFMQDSLSQSEKKRLSKCLSLPLLNNAVTQFLDNMDYHNLAYPEQKRLITDTTYAVGHIITAKDRNLYDYPGDHLNVLQLNNSRDVLVTLDMHRIPGPVLVYRFKPKATSSTNHRRRLLSR